MKIVFIRNWTKNKTIFVNLLKDFLNIKMLDLHFIFSFFSFLFLLSWTFFKVKFSSLYWTLNKWVWFSLYSRNSDCYTKLSSVNVIFLCEFLRIQTHCFWELSLNANRFYYCFYLDNYFIIAFNYINYCNYVIII